MEVPLAHAEHGEQSGLWPLRLRLPLSSTAQPAANFNFHLDFYAQPHATALTDQAPVNDPRLSHVLLPALKMALNGTNLAASTSYSSPILDVLDPSLNGFDDPPIELLEAELPLVDDGQVPLGELVSRVVQACYAEMTEMAET